METTIQQATVGKSYRVIIRAKYLPPTNHRGSRITVTHGSGTRLIVQWDYSLDLADNYAQAIQKYLDKMGWDGHWIIGHAGTGYVAVWAGNQ